MEEEEEEQESKLSDEEEEEEELTGMCNNEGIIEGETLMENEYVEDEDDQRQYADMMGGLNGFVGVSGTNQNIVNDESS